MLKTSKSSPQSGGPWRPLASKRHRTCVRSEEIAKLWMNENSVVNQKAAYFTAVNGALLVAMKDQATADLIYLTFCAGVLVCLIAFLSISRTCAYRKALRDKLNNSRDYGPLLTGTAFQLHQRLPSNVLLTVVPLLAIPAWFYVAHVKLNAHHIRFPWLCL
jgi:hypothetical protein